MRFSDSIIYIFALWTICACQNVQKEELFFNKDNTFTITEKGQDVTKKFSSIAESWQIIGKEIITTNSTPDSLFSILSCTNLKTKNVFGKKGHGANEFVAPLVFCDKDKRIGIIDNLDKKIYTYDKGNLTQIGTSAIRDALNDLKCLSYPIVAYSTITPSEQRLKIVDLDTGKDIDSVVFKDDKHKGEISLFDFSWNHKDGKIVIALMHSDMFIVCDTDSNGNLTQTCTYQTNGKFYEDKIYYSDVACGQYIYLLSQQDVDLSKMSGHSAIEIYDYSGKPIKKIDLSFIADKMLLDSSYKRLLFTSTNDEDLHIINI